MLDLTIKQATEVPVWSEAIAEAGFEALDELGFQVSKSDIGTDDLKKVFYAMLAAAPTVKAEQVQGDECGGNGAGVDHEDDCSKAPAQQGEAVEVVEVRGLQWLDTGHYRKKPPQFGYNPHDWNPLMTVAQHERILAALADNSGNPNLPAGCKVVPVELLERLEHVTRTLVPHLQCHVELRALLASAEGVKDE